MIRHTLVAFFLISSIFNSAQCADSHSKAISDESKEIRSVDNKKYNYLMPIALGITQGITEFLPISSTGHMIIVNKFFKDDDDSSANIRSEAMKAYFAVIQIGSILAILLLYRHRIYDMFLAFLGKSKSGMILIKKLMLSFLPAAFCGLLFDGIIQRVLYNSFYIAYALVAGAGVMIFAEYVYQGKYKKNNFEKISYADCLKIGVWQCLALFPGMSRSMCTIVGGYFSTLKREAAVEYSFLLGFISLSATTMFKLLKNHDAIFCYFDVNTFLLGIFTALIFSVLSIKIFIKYISKHGMRIFVWYRITLGVLIIFLLE